MHVKCWARGGAGRRGNETVGNGVTNTYRLHAEPWSVDVVPGSGSRAGTCACEVLGEVWGDGATNQRLTASQRRTMSWRCFAFLTRLLFDFLLQLSLVLKSIT